MGDSHESCRGITVRNRMITMASMAFGVVTRVDFLPRSGTRRMMPTTSAGSNRSTAPRCYDDCMGSSVAFLHTPPSID